VYFNEQEVAGVTDAIFDTGTSLIVGDNRTVQAIYDKIPGSALSNTAGIYQSMDPGIRQLSIQRQTDSFLPVPCSFNDPISFEFGSKNFSVSINLGPISENSTTCIGGLIGGSREY